ncbi:MAG TPA: orc1/cdc6 family replication initiation protein [Nitrososphaera sp.]|nr:orc1/cdc6 family replication initiation protein [Nitrososphaera sp.]
MSSSSDIDNIFNRAASGKSLIKNRQTLTIDYVPDRLPFREQEENAVAQVLSTVFRSARPSNLLLFGEPGTGKTAVVKKVVERLGKKANELKSSIRAVNVNAKGASTAYKVLFEIAEDLGLNREQDKVRQIPFTGLSIGEATSRILQFVQKNKIGLILVIDEIDSLVDKSGDDVLYSFTRANQHMTKGGFISLIGISNSLDFKDKLDPRVRSSLSEEEIVFNPYTIDQLRQILNERSTIAFNEGAITDAAINLCSAMAGREHGDARKAIDLLRVGAEIAERENAARVEERHVREAQDKIERDAPYVLVKNFPAHMKLVVLAIAKSKDGFTGEVYDLYSSLCREVDQDPLTQRRVTQMISKLELLGLVATDVVNQGRYGRTQKIRLKFPLVSVKEALKEDSTFSALIE